LVPIIFSYLKTYVRSGADASKIGSGGARVRRAINGAKEQADASKVEFEGAEVRR
jgi:hypothetical protein